MNDPYAWAGWFLMAGCVALLILVALFAWLLAMTVTG